MEQYLHTNPKHLRSPPFFGGVRVANSLVFYERGTKDTKGTVKLINLKQTENAMAQNETDKQTNNRIYSSETT